MEPIDSGKFSRKKHFNPLIQVCLTRTCLNSGAKGADEAELSHRRFCRRTGYGREAGSALVACDTLQDTGMSPRTLLQPSICVLLAALRAPWSVSETHTGTLVWSQFVPPACCWWLLVAPFPSKNSCRRHSVMEFRGSAQNTSSTAGSAGNKLLTADFSRSLC